MCRPGADIQVRPYAPVTQADELVGLRYFLVRVDTLQE